MIKYNGVEYSIEFSLNLTVQEGDLILYSIPAQVAQDMMLDTALAVDIMPYGLSVSCGGVIALINAGNETCDIRLSIVHHKFISTGNKL